MPDSPEHQMDRYFAGELSAPEQRDLAQAALDDPELFDELTTAAVIRTTVLRDGASKPGEVVELRPRIARPTPESPRAPGRASVRPLGWPLTLAGIAAAAVAAIAFVMVYRSSSTVPLTEPTPTAPLATTVTSGVANSTGIAPHPAILTARLDTLAGRSTAVFRADEARSRPPKGQGAVTSVDEREVAIDLGSLDGVVKGSQLRVVRGDTDPAAVGRLTIVTVFRERSRGRMAASAGPARVGDKAEVAPGVQTAALLEHVAAFMAAGDTVAARALAERAVSISRTPDVPSGARRQALAQLGTLDHRAGALDDAERHLRGAVDDVDADPATAGVQRAQILNELGAVLIERGEYPEAEVMLRRAQPNATGAAAVHVANNLAALAALRRDAPAAESLYRSALTLAGSSPDLEAERQAILKNLESVKAPR